MKKAMCLKIMRKDDRWNHAQVGFTHLGVYPHENPVEQPSGEQGNPITLHVVIVQRCHHHAGVGSIDCHAMVTKKFGKSPGGNQVAQFGISVAVAIGDAVRRRVSGKLQVVEVEVGDVGHHRALEYDPARCRFLQKI